MNTLFNVGVTIAFLVKEFIDGTKDDKPTFPDFYFGKDCFIYSYVSRMIVCISCFVICILFFIPLFSLFRMQLSTAIEKRQIRKDESEYEKNQLRAKLDEEVWEDLVYEEDGNNDNDNDEDNDINNNKENTMIELNVKDTNTNNTIEENHNSSEPLIEKF